MARNPARLDNRRGVYLLRQEIRRALTNFLFAPRHRLLRMPLKMETAPEWKSGAANRQVGVCFWGAKTLFPRSH
jgi:hypothetical protein